MCRRKLCWYFFVLFILAYFESTTVFCAETKDDTPWKLSIAVPESNGLRSIHLRPTEHFHVVLQNKFKNDQKIWKDTNSWGYAVLYFELTYENGTKKIIRKQSRTWRKNAPGYWTINAGEYLVYDVFLSRGDWDLVFPQDVTAGRVKMQAVIEIPTDEQTQKFGVWSGRIKSAAREVNIFE